MTPITLLRLGMYDAMRHPDIRPDYSRYHPFYYLRVSNFRFTQEPGVINNSEEQIFAFYRLFGPML